MTAPHRRNPVARAGHAVFAFFYNKKVGVVLILLVAVATLLGTIITQAPDGTYDHPDSRDAFLAQMQMRYGGWTKPLDWLGMFHIYSSPLFFVLCALLTLSIIACTLHRIPLLWRKATKPRTRVSARFFEHAQYQGQIPTKADPEDALEATRAALKRTHYRVLDAPGEGPAGLYADRFRFGPFGTVVAHASFVIIIAAVVISSLTGLDKTVTIPVGGQAPVGAGTHLTIEAASFHDSYDKKGRPTDYVSTLVLRDAGRQVARQEVRVNQPLRYGGYKFHQASYGFAAQIRAASKNRPLYSGAVALDQQSGDQNYHYGTVNLPPKKVQGRTLRLLVATPAAGAQGADVASGQALIQVIDVANHSKVLAEKTVDQGTSATIAGVDVTFVRETPYTGITIRRDPGAPWMWVGSVLLVLGMTCTFGLRHRRLWVRVIPGAQATVREGADHIRAAHTVVEVASVDTSDSAFERQFAALVGAIETELKGPDVSPNPEKKER
ncbi:MAG: cytochrome c biogenesis protein ResB [Actinomycetaceae bacterium]|nr:cytochrome c biogenesis protein ResB [Actinomycetaceae bacterium]MDU0969790.1 cytochrome c biogenesis protein ResB [Actinomycetaceae bacterium]